MYLTTPTRIGVTCQHLGFKQQSYGGVKPTALGIYGLHTDIQYIYIHCISYYKSGTGWPGDWISGSNSHLGNYHPPKRDLTSHG